MRKLNRILSYLVTFLLGVTFTLVLVRWLGTPVDKLTQLEYLISQRFIGEWDQTRLEDGAAAGMVAALGDRWSHYIPAANVPAYMEQQENAYVGIGITIHAEEEGLGIPIIGITKNAPAEAAGILPGDYIVEAGGQSTAGMTTDDLAAIIRGPEGTNVVLRIRRGEEILEFTVQRAAIFTDVVTTQMLSEDIGLISILNFDSRCAQESIAAIEDLMTQGAKALIFDVRNNPGGYADELVKLLDYLLPEGVLFRSVNYAGKEDVEYSDAQFLDLPIAVLCNENTYSAAEFFAAAIQEYGAGQVVGVPTCGKGYYQVTYQLMDGSAVGLSEGKYFTPNGVSLAGIGIQPDVLVEVDDETAAAILYFTLDPDKDPQIQAAMDSFTK